jgi:hypothetical protein
MMSAPQAKFFELNAVFCSKNAFFNDFNEDSPAASSGTVCQLARVRSNEK